MLAYPEYPHGYCVFLHSRICAFLSQNQRRRPPPLPQPGYGPAFPTRPAQTKKENITTEKYYVHISLIPSKLWTNTEQWYVPRYLIILHRLDFLMMTKMMTTRETELSQNLVSDVVDVDAN